MEVPGGRQNIIHLLIYEVMGSCSLIYAVNMSNSFGATAGSFQPQSVGLMLFINIMFLGGVSGGHFNPAVTAAVYIKDLQENPSKMI